MENEADFNQKIYFLQRCFLGREPKGEADSGQTEEGNGLALIQAFILYQSVGAYPAPWILNGLGSAFTNYLMHNQDAAGHKNYRSIDKCIGLSVKAFNAMNDETRSKTIAERIYLLKWAFGFRHKQIITILEKSGFKIEVTGKENKDPERVYERTPYAKYYNTFEKMVSGRYDKSATALRLLEEMPPEARKYVERLRKQQENNS